MEEFWGYVLLFLGCTFFIVALFSSFLGFIAYLDDDIFFTRRVGVSVLLIGFGLSFSLVAIIKGCMLLEG